MRDVFDVVVLGAGRRGLTAALQTLRDRPEAGVLVVDAAPSPGGGMRTLRSNGFVCELGAFAFDPAEVAPTLALLARPPSPVECLTRHGAVFTGSGLVEVRVDPLPVSFAAGTEELAQACRRALGPRLWLGRRAERVQPATSGWQIELGGESKVVIAAEQVVIATSTSEAARMLGALDRELQALALRLRTETRAFAFLGGHRTESPELVGYGIVPAEGVESPVAEVIVCDAAFPGRALPGRRLVRCEVRGPLPGEVDAAVLAAAEHELRRWTGTAAPFPFTKLHRFATAVDDAALVECRARLHGLVARATGLSLA